jgi:hypothetical protein
VTYDGDEGLSWVVACPHEDSMEDDQAIPLEMSKDDEMT